MANHYKRTQQRLWIGFILTIFGLSIGVQGKAIDKGLEITTEQGFRVFNQSTPFTLEWETTDPDILHVDIILIPESGNEFVIASNYPNTNAYELNFSSAPIGKWNHKIRVKDSESEKSTIFRGPFYVTSTIIQAEPKSSRYYAGLHQTINRHSFETTDQYLRFELRETNSASSRVIVELVDLSASVKAILGLEKQYGQNYYTIDLNDENLANQGFIPELGKTYYLKTISGNTEDLGLKFTYTEVPEVRATITSSDAIGSCSISGSVSIDFKAKVENGNKTYRIEWFISPTIYIKDGTALQKFHFVPKQSTAGGYGHISEADADRTKVTILDDPAYYVILKVTDQCGRVSKHVGHVTCETSSGPDNSIIINLSSTPTNSDG